MEADWQPRNHWIGATGSRAHGHASRGGGWLEAGSAVNRFWIASNTARSGL